MGKLPLFIGTGIIALMFIAVSLQLVEKQPVAPQFFENETKETALVEPPQQLEAVQAMTFSVSIPENTPPDDTVYIYLHTQRKYRMEYAGNFTYAVTLNRTELAPLFPDGAIRYRYSRNGYDFRTAEYLEPTPSEPERDSNDYFWTKQGRSVVYSAGSVVKDVISRWRWFPEKRLPEATSAIKPGGDFLDRLNGEGFRSGQTIEDLYVDAFHEFFNSTALHMKRVGYTWVELDPPWQWVERNGMPMVVNDYKNNPNYPTDEIFMEELRAYKSAGLKVMIGPQLCCSPLDARSKSKDWWDRYFAETERFLVHFAKLSQQQGADAFFYAVPLWDAQNAPFDTTEKWKDIFAEVRKVFKKEVGQMVWVLGPNVSKIPQPIPDTKFVKWGSELDFFLVSADYPISTKDAPSDDELKKGTAAVLDGVRVLYEEFKKPVIIRNSYFNVRYSWKGQSFYHINSVPWISDPEVSLKQSVYEFDAHDHARVVNAYFESIAERPWVTGYFHFGYTHWEDPLSPWMSVRGKPAEDVWRKWNMAALAG